MPYLVAVRGKVWVAGEMGEEDLMLILCCLCVSMRRMGCRGIERPRDEKE